MSGYIYVATTSYCETQSIYMISVSMINPIIIIDNMNEYLTDKLKLLNKYECDNIYFYQHNIYDDLDEYRTDKKTFFKCNLDHINKIINELLII
ncbi:hypothetical protein [Alphaentomopoxvirus acuprea]|uniref:Uncharacterized protein n=1 Tax=Alphaentomopoxvirus acuprea TaxID=62099 RepID=W6JL87_9POXV|nr:hypothetical protein BA82_gp031 [Anomala cuprea entomopoxvirus]BAO49391.1 hypothetical protein [Anomala cuprea entomopoxvirus]